LHESFPIPVTAVLHRREMRHICQRKTEESSCGFGRGSTNGHTSQWAIEGVPPLRIKVAGMHSMVYVFGKMAQSFAPPH